MSTSRRLFVPAAMAVILAGCAGGASPVPPATSSAAVSTPVVMAPPIAATASAAAATSRTASRPSATATAEPTIHLMTIAPPPTAVAYGPVSVLTGAESCGVTSGTSTTDPDGTEHGRGGAVECTDWVNDPRVSGPYTGTWNVDWWGTPNHSSGALVQWGTVHRENADGGWGGRYSGVFSDDRGDTIVFWWTGTGAYAGLSYFELSTGMTPWKVQGQVFPGAPPTAASLPAAAGGRRTPAGTIPAAAPASTGPEVLAPTPVPTPTAIAYGPVVSVSGVEFCTNMANGVVTHDADGTMHTRGSLDCTDKVNDPRVSGTYHATWLTDRWGPSDADAAMVQWGASRLQNAGGAWDGRLAGVWSTASGDIYTFWYTGTGGYAGLGYFELVTGRWPSWTVQGQVFPGAPPTP